MTTVTRLEGVLNDMVTRAIEAVLAAKMAEIEEAAQLAIERGLERSLRGQEMGPAAASSVAGGARRPVPGVVRRAAPGAARRATEARAAAARAPAKVIHV